MRLLLGMDGFFYLSFPGKQVYWMVAENGRFESMKQKKEREKEISQWPWISMLPFGILAGYWGDKEVRITAISEYGFQTRLAAPATAEQKKVWFSGITKETFVALQNSAAGSGQPIELALELDRPEWYKAYLSMESGVFFDAYFRKNQIPDPPLFHPDRLYIGNAFCPHLAPTEEELFALMDKACRESFSITLTFPFLLEENLSETQQRLQRLAEWCERKNKTVELVVNDWGTAHLAAHFPVFSICLGILLNKRKKDPRMAYKLGDRTLFEKNSVHAAFYRKYLKAEFQIERYEWESCGNTGTGKFPEGKNSMHLPFYQTNTSQYCPLYVACTKGSRSAQMPVRECPRFCEKQAFLYPEHLRMMGRYNSLFGVDLDVWKRMREMLKLCGVDRVVVNLL